jgi:hypothetical protein
MSTSVVNKINEMQDEINSMQNEIYSIDNRVDKIFYGSFILCHEVKKEIQDLIIDLLNINEIEKNISQNSLTKNIVTQDDINKFFKYTPSNTNFNIVNVDNVQYILIKDNSHLRYNLNKTSDKYYTYKISKDNNHNYIEDISKTKKRLCCHCGYKLNYNIIGNDEEKKQIREYYCYSCDSIKLNYNSVIIFKGNYFYAKDINWSHRFHYQDEICDFSTSALNLTSNMLINVDKQCEILTIDNHKYKIYWYYEKNICKYAFSRINSIFFLCKNSIVLFNNEIIPIETTENDKSYYKLTINGFELSGHRFRPDLLKCES